MRQYRIGVVFDRNWCLLNIGSCLKVINGRWHAVCVSRLPAPHHIDNIHHDIFIETVIFWFFFIAIVDSMLCVMEALFVVLFLFCFWLADQRLWFGG